MSDFHAGDEKEFPGRPRRAGTTEHLFTARPFVSSMPETEDMDSFAPKEENMYPPNEEDSWDAYEPNEERSEKPAPDYRGDTNFTPNEEEAEEESYRPLVSKPASPYARPSSSWEESPIAQWAQETQEEPFRPSADASHVAASSSLEAYYRRPDAGQAFPEEEGTREEQFAYAPPPKFTMPQWKPLGLEPEESAPTPAPQRNVYQPKAATWAETARRESVTLRQQGYQVEPEGQHARPKRRKKRRLRALLALVGVLCVLGGAAYLGRGWIAEQLAALTGKTAEVAAGQTDLGTAAAPVKGYDPAQPVKVNEKAQQGIAAVAGSLPLDLYAATADNVVARTKTGEGRYDAYLFSAAKGQLLGYFEDLSETGILPQAGDTFYLEQPPYLLNGQGKALLTTSMYAQYVGKQAVLGPFENGWAIISDPEGRQFNYINHEGKLLSTLWFARALPFYGQYTIAYVDTGNVGKPEERYSLHILTVDGTMERWQYTADTAGVVNAASDMALLATGELISLEDNTQTICRSNDVRVYLDCEAMVVRDESTGKYGLFVDGEQHYDFAYDSIEPVPCEIQWKQAGGDGFTLLAVTGATYPQPLSHYFTLTKEGSQELVALSTRSVYPVILQ